MDPFRRLPLEIICTLLTELPSTDLCSLRLTSRAVASVSSRTLLPQPFWKSRFMNNFEMTFFFPSQTCVLNRRNINWYALYAHVHSLVDKHPGLRNRRRIWSCLSYFCSSIEPILNNRSAGTCNWPPAQITPVRDLLSESHQAGVSVRTHSQHNHALQYLPLLKSGRETSFRLSVSFIDFNCRRYISGFRIFTSHGCKNDAAVNEAGIVVPTVEENLHFDQDTTFVGVKVYSVPDGVVGIQFIPGSQNASAGYCPASDNYVAVAELYPRESGQLCGLIVTLDVSATPWLVIAV